VGSPPSTICSADVPRPAWDVRRRRYGERRWLVRHNEIYEIDEVVDVVWLACRRGLSVAGIVAEVGARTSTSMSEALELTGQALVWLCEADLIDVPHD